MRSITESVSVPVIQLFESLRRKFCDADFIARHRVRAQDFTRQRQLTFPVVMLFILQKTVKSIQRHLHEFLNELAGGELFEPLTAGAVTKARAKLKHSAFVELNQATVVPWIYCSERAPRAAFHWLPKRQAFPAWLSVMPRHCSISPTNGERLTRSRPKIGRAHV